MHQISDIDDPRVVGYRDLPSRKELVDERIIVESELAVRRLLESDAEVESVLAVDKRAGSLPVRDGVPIYTTSQKMLEAIVGFPMTRGAMALAKRPAGTVDQLAGTLASPGIILCAAGVGDTANLGSIARNGRALGASGLLIDAKGGDIYARKAIRTSMGNVFAQTVAVAELVPAIAALKRAAPDLVVAATTLSERSIDVAHYDTPERLLLIVGNEGSGVPRGVLAIADVELTVPMRSGADSLNVAAASAVFLYALTCRRPR